MIFDTLTYGGVEKSFAAWGFGRNSVHGKKRVNAADTFTATLVNAVLATECDSPTFAFEGKIIVRVNRALSGGTFSGGTVKFVGKCISQPARASGRGQGVTYNFQGPWYDLMNTDLQQLFQGNGQTYLLPETILNTSTAVTVGQIQISVGDQIQAALQWVLDQYAAQGMAAPFQYVGRALNAGAIDLNVNPLLTGTPGGDYSFIGRKYNYHLPTGGSLTIDVSLYSLFLPTFIEKPMKVAQVLNKCLELSPRINIWFDYTATSGGSPLPMIRVDLVDSMTAMNLPLFTGPKFDGTVSHKSISITPRDDLRVRAVIITYRITNTISGQKVVDYAVDKWSGNGTAGALPGASNVNPSGAGDNANDPNCGLRVISEIIDLQGLSQTMLKGHLDLELLAAIGGTQASKRAWWAAKRGGELAKLEDSRVRFQDKTGTATTIPDAKYFYATTGVDSAGAAVTAGQEFTSADYAFYLYRVVRGTYHAWMAQGSTNIQTVKCKALAKMTFAEYDATSTSGTPDTDTSGNANKRMLTSDHHVNLELTNAVPPGGTSGKATFNVIASATPGESYIIGAGGIAQYVYTHLNARQYDGDYVSVAANFVDSTSSQYVTLGKKLNLTGGATLWTTMNAQIMEISEDYGTHETSVQIGVGKILSVSGLSGLFNMWRFRRTWYNPAVRTDNTQVGGGNVDMAQSGAGANTTQGLENVSAAQQFDYSTPPSGSSPGVANSKVTSDPTQVTIAMNL